MKLGIVTFSHANNLGALLQAYALQQTLSQLGADAEFISFRATQGEDLLSREGKYTKYPRLEARFQEIQAYKRKRDFKFDEFRKNYLKVSDPYSKSDREGLNRNYDGFIAGSDQVWNCEIPDVDGRYFLSFAQSDKKLAYAASFGLRQLPEVVKERYASYLCDFKAISVRERTGKNIIKDLIGRDVPVCLDPTFLLPGGQWEKLAAACENDAFVLLYLADYDAQLLSGAKQAACAMGLKLKVVTASFHFLKQPETWYGTGVTDFVSLVKKAVVVFTNSFHGTALSIIFRKEFLVSPACAVSARGSRLTDLLESLGLSGRMALESPQPVNWEQVEQRLEPMKNPSIAYLKSILPFPYSA